MKIVGRSDHLRLRGAAIGWLPAIGYPGQKKPKEDGLEPEQQHIYGFPFCEYSLVSQIECQKRRKP